MLTYHSLPKGTPRWVTTALLWLGGALGVSIAAEGLLALYGLSGFLVTLFYPASGFSISPREAVYLGVLGVTAGLSATFLGFLGVRLNQLSRRAIGLSRILWIPLIVTAIITFIGYRIDSFTFGVPEVWLVAALASLLLGGVLPWMILRHDAAGRVHNR